MKELVVQEDIRSKIYTIHGLQVMLDDDLAELYGVSVKALNQAVKRNIERFPENFMFQLTGNELKILRSQIVTTNNNALRSQIATLETNENLKPQNATSNNASLRFQNGTSSNNSLRSQNVTLKTARGKHRKYLPFAFTEQGVAMISGVLRSSTAIKVSIQIMEAFVAMRRFIASNAQVFQRLDKVEIKQIEHDKKFNEIFEAIESKTIKPKQGIFFDGQIFDAYRFVSDLVRSAVRSIVLIDNFVDDSVLTLFSKRKKNVSVKILTNNISKQLALDLKKFNSQYQPIVVKEFKDSHDRFMIIDDSIVYHFGASLKDLGKKWFAFSKFDKDVFGLSGRIDYYF